VFATLLANALAHNPQLQREIIEAAVALTEDLRPEETVEVHFSPEADDHRPAR
jgi:hypothetical protein